MNVLLVYPEFPDTFWSFRYALKFIGCRSAFPPLGLLTVATMLPDAWNKRLVDLNVSRLRRRDLAWADCALISAMSVQRPSARAVVSRCREHGLRVIAGGPLFTSEPDAISGVDHLILNEAEVTLPRFLHDFNQGDAERVYRTDNHADMTTTPLPMWDLVDLNQYGSMNIQYSRGCPFNCDFCNVTALFGHRPRTKAPRQIIAELNALWERGWRRSVFFVDDNLLANKHHLKEQLLPALIDWQRDHPGIPFNTEASINLADDDDLMRMMVQAGFDTVFVGIETPDDASLEECGKTQNRRRDLGADVRRMQRTGLQVQGGFIVGFDHDTPSVFQKQIDFIQTNGIVTAMVGLLEALPGTTLYERLKQANRLLPRETSGDNVDGTTNIKTVMNAELLHQKYRELMNHLYTPKRYYGRVRTFLREYEPPAIRARLTWDRLLAGFRSAIRLGVLGAERVHYWRLMIWTACRRPSLLPLAVTLSIYGHHFRKVCRRHLQ